MIAILRSYLQSLRSRGFFPGIWPSQVLHPLMLFLPHHLVDPGQEWLASHSLILLGCCLDEGEACKPP